MMRMFEPISRVLFSKKSDEWETPDRLFAELDKRYKFTLDPCCTIKNKKCDKFYTIKEDGLKQSWVGERVYCNPPYSQASLWVRKAYLESQDHPNILVVMLLPARTDVKWFHTFVKNKAEIEFIEGRVTFKGAKSNAPFPSIFVIYGAPF